MKGLEQKIDRFVDYFHCPLEDEVDNWWERKFRHPQTRSGSIYIFSNLSIPYLHTQTTAITLYYDTFVSIGIIAFLFFARFAKILANQQNVP